MGNLNRIACRIALLSLVSAAPLAAQGGPSEQRHSHSKRGFFVFPSGHAPFLGGFSGGHHRVGIFPVVRIPRELVPLFLVDQFVFRDRGPSLRDGRSVLFPGVGPSSLLLNGAFYGGGAYGYGQTEGAYSSRRFIDQWKDADPGTAPAQAPAPPLQRSILLSQGMSEEEVARLLGTPIQRVRLSQREVWKYSGYSLVFEGGILQEIR